MGEIIVKVGLKDVLSIPVTMNDVFNLVKKQFNISAFTTGRRGRSSEAMVTAKFIFSYYCHVNLGMSHIQIGEFVGLSRTAVIHQVTTAKNYLNVGEESFTNALKTLEQNIEIFKLKNL